MSGGSAPAAVQLPDPTPAPTPAPTFRADDGSMFSDMNAYNDYNKNLKATTFNSALNSAYTGQISRGRSEISAKGLNPDDYWNSIMPQIDAQKAAVPNLDANPASYFSTDPTADYLNGLQTHTRNDQLGKLNATYGTGFESNLLPDSTGSGAIDSYLGGLTSTVDNELHNALQRGQLDPQGQQLATAEEQRQAGVGRAHLQGIANDLLTRDRTQLTGLRDTAASAVNNWQLGAPNVNIDQYLNQIGGKLSSDASGFGDQFNAQADGYNPFDINQILLKAGIGTGPTNAAGNINSTVLAAADAATKKLQPRGLGTTGAF